jgi:hypothetical protein
MEGNSFTRLLSEHREGACVDELSTALREVVEAVRRTGKAGSVVLEVKVSPASRGAGNAVTVTDHVKAKLPPAERSASFFFADEAGRLSRDNPNQMKLELKAVGEPAAAKELKAVGA